MAISEVTSYMENLEERGTRDNIHGWKGKWQTIKGLGDPENWPTMKEFVHPNGPYIRKWNIVFIVSCVLAVLLDPLFLYIPTINEDLKCVALDKNLKIAALVLRSITDLFCLLNIFFQVYGTKTCSTSRSGRCSLMQSIAKTMWKSHIIIDILAVLPLPQVAILIMFSKTKGSASSSTRTFMNFLILVQYVPRVLRIYLSCKEFKNISREETSIWLKGVLNFFMYILASHVLGALWYFFAVQRITSCWRHACRKENGCDPNNFDCHNHHTLRNITSLNDLCPIDPSDPKVFDFGIFLQVLQFGILGSTNYAQKFSNCFWWGLRNLSSLGSNLVPSINTWENLFSALISVTGLLLFLYLIGNIQTYMQLDTNRKETHRWDVRTAKKMEEKNRKLEPWLRKNGIPLHIKQEILTKILSELKEDRDVDVENILSLSILPPHLKSYMETCMPLSRLKKVPLLEDMDEAVLREISECLKPRKYRKDDIIVEEGEPLLMMIFIVDGLVSIESICAFNTLQRGAGELYGEQLLCWPAWTSYPGLSNESVKAAIGDVEVLVLMASDMERVGCKFRSEFGSKEIIPVSDVRWELLDTHLGMLRKVPKLRDMDTQVLRAISLHLKPHSYNSTRPWIIHRNQQLPMMFFITRGSVLVNYVSGHAEEEYDYVSYPGEPGWLVCKEGYIYGEELLDWVLDSSFPSQLPLTPTRVWSKGVDILYLTAKDLASVASKYKSNFSRVIPPPTTNLSTARRMFWLKIVPFLQDMDEAVLREMSEYFNLVKYKKNDIIIEEDKPLAKMIFNVGVSGTVKRLSKNKYIWNQCSGYYFGEQLLYWPAWTPIVSLETVIAEGDVDIFVLMASDIERVGRKFRWDAKSGLSETRVLGMLRKVPKLGTMDTQVLNAISLHLKPMRYSYEQQLIEEGKPVNMMIFVVWGSLYISNRPDYAEEEFDANGVLRRKRQLVGEELLDWVLDTSFPALLPISTYDVKVESDSVYVFVLMAEDLASVVSEYRSNFSKVITPPPVDLVASLGLYWLKKVPIFQNMDEEVLKEISEHMKPVSYSNDTVIIEELKPLDMMFVLAAGHSLSMLNCSYEVGEFYGSELVHWITNWVLHTGFPAELPLSPCSVRVDCNGKGNAEVLVVRADDLKRIVSKFRPEFIKETTLPIDSEGTLVTFDPFTMLKKVPMLEKMDDKVLEAICSHLKPMKYSDDTPDGRCMFKSREKIDKMFFIKGGLVSFTYDSTPRSYRYSGNYFGEQLLEWALDASVHKKPRLESLEAFMCIGEVEVLVLTVKDLAKVASEFETHFRQFTPADFLMDSD